ncbi:MAG: 3-phosphoshikimate 1-carboxyvinyltransferase [Pseudomonadota bacterium]
MHDGSAATAEPVFLCQAPERGLFGTLTVPGDKSVSHRALMLSSLVPARTTVSGLLDAGDVRATGAAMAALGAQIDWPAGDRASVIGPSELTGRAEPLDLGNSGTGMRLLCGLLAGQGVGATLTGDASLRSRPMNRIVNPLRQMGARIETAAEGRAPLAIAGEQPLTGLRYVMPMASAQLKSALLLAGLGATGETSVQEPAPTRDHSESMLAGFGVTLRREPDGWVHLAGPQVLRSPGHIEVPGDFSSAAFFLVAGSIVPESDILLKNVGINPTRRGLLDLLLEMGARIDLVDKRESGGEQVADLRVRSAPLEGIDVGPDRVPLMIDEFPVFFVAAALAKGRTRVTGAEELRVKESDRLAVMAAGLRTLGVDLKESTDGMEIQGSEGFQGGQVHGRHDHRCAMAFAIAGLRAAGEVRIASVRNVATSFPSFRPALNELGGRVEQIDERD